MFCTFPPNNRCAPVSNGAAASDPDVYLSYFKKEHPYFLFAISRSKNKNLVIYEANVRKDTGTLDLNDPVLVYWMDIDPEYIKSARLRGKMNDREDLNYIERSMAYGYSTVAKAADAKSVTIDLVALSKVKTFKQMTVLIEPEGLALAQVTLLSNNASRVVKRFHVISEDTWLGPEVKHVEMWGYDTSDPALQTRDVIYKN
jgi:hypothetical protein